MATASPVFDSGPHLERLREEGFTILEGALSATEIAEARALLAPVVAANGLGRNPFEGHRTERVYALLAKAPELASWVEDPRILALGDAFLSPGWLLSTMQAIQIEPGEAAQELHCDDDAGAPPRPRAPQGISTMWALDDFTAENGATRFVPGSHRWEAGRQPTPDEVHAAEMPAGSVFVYLGGVMHGGGPHAGSAPRLGVSIIYGQPWLRQFENQMMAIPRETAAGFSERVQRMLGYSMYGPMGTVDGRDPIRLLRRDDAER